MKDKNTEVLDLYPTLPLRDIVIFPKMIVPLFVGRNKSIKALQNIGKNNQIFLISQKDGANDIPEPNDLHKVGVIAKILQIIKLQDYSVKILVEGLEKAQVIKYVNKKEYLRAHIKIIKDTCANNQETLALRNTATNLFENYIDQSKKGSEETFLNITKITDLPSFCNALCSQIYLTLAKIALKNQSLFQLIK